MRTKRKSNKPQIAVCSFEISSASSEVQLTPAGHFRALDGRPFDADSWYIDGAIAQVIIAQAAIRKTPYIIDYEHQTLLSEKNGQPAPRAAKFTQMEWREGEGLFATDVDWTDRAKKFIDDREYGFLSPVLPYRKGTGEVLGFMHAALTNTPAIDGMDEVVSLAAAKFQSDTTQEENLMNREELIAALGLSADASDGDIKTAIAALKQQAATADTQGQTIAALKATQFNPARHIDIETYNQTKDELVALKQKDHNAEVNVLVTAGLADGKLLPNQEAWARKLGESDVAALKQYLDEATGLAALKGSQTGGKKPAGAEADALSETELAVCRQMGVSPEDYQKNKAKEV
ncbi:phage protease [Mariprofundus ferrooxydans]|uniref:Putative I protein n=1 Tax=Mariprofundus ferrooxydans PV-1 TaxID=314345 RepID=Q0EWD7_9PROT|nr:phage protease [Mariprofundus ferrooxydans]EAU53534.1 putative I protein [Mariprofundus ferrooxydans PV-1]KON47016.1 hypothetical protein AL013_10520 [Mariprofundus ferrooxydans]